MAYIAKTAFEVKISNHEFDSIANVTGYFDEICPAGFLCTRSAVTDNEGYTGVGPSDATVTIKNTNTWTMQKATDGTGVIYACNPFDVNMITDPVTGATYKVGTNTLGIPAPANYPTTFTQIQFNGVNVYRFGEGNMSAAVSDKKYFTVANGLLTPAASAPTTKSTPYFELVGTGAFTAGTQSSFTYYDLRACMTAPNTSAS